MFAIFGRIVQSLPLWGGIAVVLYLASLIVKTIYNVWFHPLRKFPGPFWARATPLPMAYHHIIGNQHKWAKEVHDKYGPVARLMPENLSYIDQNAWKDIFGHKLNGRGDIPKDNTLESPAFGGRQSIFMMEDADHARARRLVSHALSDKALREQHPILNGYVQMLVDKISNIASMPNNNKTDMVRWYNFITFDVIADLSFGEPLGMLQQGEWTPWMFAINKMIPIVSKVAIILRVFPPLGYLILLCLPRSLIQPMKSHIAYSKEQVDKRIARETDRPDFWTYIMRNQGKENGSLSRGESHAMGMSLILAGTETTATLLSGLTHMLLLNPDKHSKLVAEIREAFGSANDIGVNNLLNLPYLSACIKEGLRLYPPVPLSQSRQVPIGGRMICDEYVAANTFVGVAHWAAYRSESNFHRAEEFLPERWFPENQVSGPFANDQRDVHQPFSYGPRNCVGKNLAYHEMKLILANLLWHFDLELCDESKDWDGYKVFGLFQKGPLMVTPRLAVHEKR